MRNTQSEHPTTPRRTVRFTALGLGLAGALHAACAQQTFASLADLSLEDLSNVRVTSVTGRPEVAQDAAASIFVIRGEDIRRSAATSLPEALRLAPNLQVARLNAGQYAISARGFNDSIGNKLLVLIDGRIVYSPLFSGVFWDAQGVMLEDIERIEVISGPGATLWGANAVNGVINIISKPAGDTQGTLVSALAGPDGSVVSGRYGGTFGGSSGSDGRFRVDATRRTRDNTQLRNGREVADAGTKDEIGMRADWSDGSDRYALIGNAYQGGRSSARNLAPEMSGANLQGTWGRQLSDGSNWSLRAYFDQARREDDFVYHERTRTTSVEFDHVPVTPAAHKVIWGAGYRRSRSQTDPTLFFHFEPATRDLNWSHVFLQDEIRVSDPLRVTLGLKLESNSYTGVERLPTLRAAYRLADNSSVWAALSRAVRAPARLDRDFFLFIPGFPGPVITGGPNFVSEVANVAEFGYRGPTNATLNYSLTAFHHEYDKLRAGHAAPTTIDNLAWGTTNGLEAWGSWRVSSVWQLSGGLLALNKSLHAAASAALSSVANLGNDPKSQWSLRSTSDLGRQVTLDVAVRHVSALPQPAVPAYTATDLRLAWQASPLMELALIVQNLFDPGHAEFQAPAAASEIPRSVFLSMRWRVL